jgi:hypothetical protein
MDVQGALRARLLGATAAGQRVYWVQRPQESQLPAITLEVVSGDRPRTYSALQVTRSPRIQMNVWAATYAEAQAILEAAVTTLEPGRTTSNGIFFDNIEFEGEGDAPERLGTTDIVHKRIDLIVWHQPA